MAEEIIEVIYMKNDKWKEDNSEKDGYSIAIDEYSLDRCRVNKSKTGVVNSLNYLCRAKKCSASITIKADGSLSRSKLVHDDDVAHSKVTHQQLEIKHFKDTIKERASVESMPSQKIYNEEVVNLIKSTGQTMEDIEKLIPTFSNMKTALT